MLVCVCRAETLILAVRRIELLGIVTRESLEVRLDGVASD